MDVRRSARLLSLSVAVSWGGVQISGALSSIIAVQLTGRLDLAGVPFFLVNLGASIAAYPAGWLMDRFGRVPVLAAGHVIAAAGFTFGAYAIAVASTLLFFVSVLVAAFGAGATYLTRLAAADLYPAHKRATGLSIVVFASVVGAVLGWPLITLSQWLGDEWGLPYTLVAWSMVPFLSGASALIVLLIRPDPRDVAAQIQGRDPKPTVGRASSKPVLGRLRAVLLAAACLVLAQAAMIEVMSVSGASLEHAGHSPNVIGATLTAHVVGMFAFAPLIGRFADRHGRRVTLAASAVLLLLGAGGVATFADRLMPLTLFLVGVGWSFAFIGATAVVADASRALNRGRLTASLDVATAVAGATSALVGGWALSRGGLEWVGSFALIGAVGIAVAVAFLPRNRAPIPRLAPTGAAE